MKWIVDSGHAWLRVLKRHVNELGLQDKISDFSFQNDAYVYLEEDCDAPKYLEAINKKARDFDEIFYPAGAPCRDFARYQSKVA